MPHPTDFDNTQACTEGWDIFACDGSANGAWQIQRIDCPEEWERYDPSWKTFDDDVAAWTHVVTQALAGSAYHQLALDIIQEHNPDFCTEMRAWVRIRVPAIAA